MLELCDGFFQRSLNGGLMLQPILDLPALVGGASVRYLSLEIVQTCTCCKAEANIQGLGSRASTSAKDVLGK